MAKDYVKLIHEIEARDASLGKAAPKLMKAFDALVTEAGKAGALDTKTKELLALGIAVAVRCEACITLHTAWARDHGATRDEVAEAVGVAVQMAGAPALVHGAEALEAFDQFAAEAEA